MIIFHRHIILLAFLCQKIDFSKPFILSLNFVNNNNIVIYILQYDIIIAYFITLQDFASQ